MRYAMQLRDIEYMVTIADKQSFSQAAEALFISQPALSQSIKRLEEEIGVALFARKRKKPASCFCRMPGKFCSSAAICARKWKTSSPLSKVVSALE